MATKEAELGIGASSIAEYRYKVIDYLPWMYVFELSLTSRRPEEIASYDTLIYPFDSYIWCFIIGATLVTFTLLLTMQKLWNHIYGKSFTFDHIFKGNSTYKTLFNNLSEFSFQTSSSRQS